MEKRRPGQGGRERNSGYGKPRPEGSGRAERREKPERKSKPEGKPWEERKPKRDESRTERPERRSKPEGKPWEDRRPKRDEGRPERIERRSRPEGQPREERRPKRDEGRTERPERRSKPEGKPWEERRPKRDEGRTERPERKSKPEGKPWEDRRPKRDEGRPERKSSGHDEKPGAYQGKPRTRSAEKEETIRLNKYISNSGICSRREADTLITAGVVRVNGKIVTELGMKVLPTDKVQVEEKNISMEKPKYVLLNKPKGFITTVDDPDKRKTVMSLIRGACKERVYPVGRLDMNTTGLLLFTNDGNIAKKLTHPKYGIKKIYHVELDKSLSKADYEQIRKGVELEDGKIIVDKIEYIEESKSRKEIGLELHSGQNRIVRRIFEHFEYKVVRLDRVYYAGLTKKNLPRGHWRLLEEKEINLLKMISS